MARYFQMECKFILKIPRMKVAPSIASKIEARLANEVARYPIRNFSTRMFSIPAGALEYQTDPFGVGSTTLPQTAILALVATSSVQGVQKESPFWFNNYGLSDISLNYEGSTLPTPSGFKNLTWSGDFENFMLAYYALFDYTVKEDYGCGIQIPEYKDSFAMYKFSFGNYLNNAHDHREPGKIGNCRLSLSFSPRSHNASLTLLIFQERDNMIAINGQREIMRDFVL